MNLKDLLYKPIEDVDSRKGRGGVYDYIKWQHIADRMNEVFGMNWSSHVESQDMIGNDIILRVSVCARDPETGEMFCQEGYGGSTMRQGEEAASAHKGAYSKALKDACKKWGVGLHFDSADGGPVGSNVPNGYMGHTTGVPPQGAPTSQPMAPAPSMPAATQAPTPAPMRNTQTAPVQQMHTPGPGNIAPPSTPAPAPAPGPAASPVPQSVPQVHTPSAQGQAPAPAPTQGANMGMAPPVSPQVQTATNSVGSVMSDPDAEVSLDAPGTLNNVQDMAIKNMAAMKGANDEAAIVELITSSAEIGLNRPLHKISDLSYNEAVRVIKAIKKLQ